MRLLCVTPLYAPAPGGAQGHLRDIATRLVARGHEVTVLTANIRNEGELWQGTPAGLPEQETLDGVTVRRLRPDGGLAGALLDAWQGLPGGYRSATWLFGAEGFGLLVRKPRPAGLIPAIIGARADIVVSFNWYWPPAYHVYLARKLRYFRLVGIPLFHVAQEWSHADVYKRMLGQCDAVVTNTQFEAEFAEKQGAVRARPAGVGVQPDLFEQRNGRQIRERYRLNSYPVVGFVGRQAANKGAGTLIRAMRAVWAVRPEVRLLMAGPSPQANGELDLLIRTLTPFEMQRIVFVNEFPEEEKASIYDAMDVFAMPSTAESFGIAYLEAWMCGKPVIGARIGSTQCVIEDGADGLLVAPQDAEGTARAILELLRDKNRRESMGRCGHAKTLADFTWDKVTDRVERLLLELAGECTR